MALQKEIHEVVWPRGRRSAGLSSYARRLDTLEGKTICELWEWLFYGEEIFPEIEKELSKRYPGVKFVGYEAFGSTGGGTQAEMIPALPGKLKQQKCDAVISGVGC